MSSKIKVQRLCEYCGNEFSAQTTKTKYCSKNCNSRHYKQKKRQSIIELSNTSTSKTRTESLVDINKKEVLSISETALYLGITRQTVYNWLNNGSLIGKRMSNRKVLILKAHLTESIEQNTVYEKSTPSKRKPITEFYTINEVIERYNVGNTWVFRIIKENKIPKTRIGGKTHVSKKHIDSYFKKNRNDVSNITEWYTVKELQEKHMLSRDQVYSRVHDNGIPKQRIGKFVKISKQHFDELFVIGV